MGNRTAQKDAIRDITSDSQVNSNFPYRWSPASLTFKNYFHLCLYLYIKKITLNNNTRVPKFNDWSLISSPEKNNGSPLLFTIYFPLIVWLRSRDVSKDPILFPFSFTVNCAKMCLASSSKLGKGRELLTETV